MRRKSTGETSRKALTIENRGKTKERGKGSSNHRMSKQGRSKSLTRRLECWGCREQGHLKRDYRFAKNKKGKDNQEDNKEANVTSGDVLQDALILSLDTAKYWRTLSLY